METQTTKERILDEAIKLFSELGYDAVSMRDIAVKVGIKAASIYNHFHSKKEILEEMYVFYIHIKDMAAPDLKSLLVLLETEPIMDVLMKMDFHYDPALQEKMDRIFFIASQRICQDKEVIIRKYFFEPFNKTLSVILNRAIELGKIEPIDVDCFIWLANYYAFSAAELNLTSMKISLEQWQKGLGMIFSLIKPVKNKRSKTASSAKKH
jgi:AcrR family transcriptional regulator